LNHYTNPSTLLDGDSIVFILEYMLSFKACEF